MSRRTTDETAGQHLAEEYFCLSVTKGLPGRLPIEGLMQTNTKNFRGTDQVAEMMAPAPSREVERQPRACLFEIPELRAARRFAANRHSALKKAEDIGYVDGFSDRHEVDHEFDSGGEWMAWLVGWRNGQAELRKQRQLAAKLFEIVLADSRNG